VRAVDCAHFAPPTHRPRRDGLDHGRSVPLSVALGGDDYAFVPPAAPVSRTDRFFIFGVLKLKPVFYRATELFHGYPSKNLRFARNYRLHNEPSDDTLCK